MYITVNACGYTNYYYNYHFTIQYLTILCSVITFTNRRQLNLHLTRSHVLLTTSGKKFQPPGNSTCTTQAYVTLVICDAEGRVEDCITL